MAFADFMKPHLNPTKEISKNEQWYINATCSSLNLWFEQLECVFMLPCLDVMGTVVTWAGVTSPLYAPKMGYFVPKRVRFTEKEVKDAMWCGDPNLSFINLFKLVGDKFSQNFNKAIATPLLIGGQAIPTLITEGFVAAGTALMAWAKSVGMAKTGPKMTPEDFLQKESDLLLQAVKTIPPVPAVVVGDPVMFMPVTTAAGTFTGTIGVNFAAAV